MKMEGREIIDIGPDFSRRSLGREPSDFYNMERSEVKGYSNYKKVFEKVNFQVVFQDLISRKAVSNAKHRSN